MNVGMMAASDGGRIDFAGLRSWRRSRLLDAMSDAGVDCLLLGRPANVAYASGARQLWTAGARPFGPGCVVVAATGRIHLLSVWDEGVPPEIDHTDLFGLSWNPAVITRSLQAIPGLADARRVGSDGLSPGLPHLLGLLAPDADLVDAGPLLRSVRSVKSDDELACIATATALAEAGLQAMAETLRPGVGERELVGAYLARIASLGAPTPPTEAVACATPRRGAVRLELVARDRIVGPGELVVLNPGALFAGYEGGLGRTLVAGGASPDGLVDEVDVAVAAMVACCRAGATGRDLRQAWQQSGLALPAGPLATGLGLGVEPPVVAPGIGDDAELRVGMVLAVQGWAGREGVGGALRRETVAITADGPRRLSR